MSKAIMSIDLKVIKLANLYYKKVMRRKLARNVWHTFSLDTIMVNKTGSVYDFRANYMISDYIQGWYKYIGSFTNILVEEIEQERAKKKCSCPEGFEILNNG